MMNKKIDVYADGDYVFSTNSFKTCKEAIKRAKLYIRTNVCMRTYKDKKITARFDKVQRG